MKIKTSLEIQAAIVAASLAISAYYYTKLPDIVPTHSNIRGQVDQYGSKLTPVLMGPALVLFGAALTLALPKLSPKKYEIDRFESAYGYAMTVMSCFFLFIQVVILQMAEGKANTGSTIMIGMFLLFVFLGNILGKVRRNFYMGIRTPWTLASEATWDATHRLAGKIFFYGGLAGAVLSAAGIPMALSIGFLMFLSFWPVVQSYFIYKKLG